MTAGTSQPWSGVASARGGGARSATLGQGARGESMAVLTWRELRRNPGRASFGKRQSGERTGGKHGCH